MDIFDIIVEPPESGLEFNLSYNLLFNNDYISIFLFITSLILTLLVSLYYRRFIALNCLNFITALIKHQQISYKHFAYLLAQILCYKHQTTTISKEAPPIKCSKDNVYLWIGLVDTLNEVRYGKDTFSEQSYIKLHKTALEWLRQS